MCIKKLTPSLSKNTQQTDLRVRKEFVGSKAERLYIAEMWQDIWEDREV